MTIIKENEKFTIDKKYKIFILEDGKVKEPTETYASYENGSYPDLFSHFDSEDEALEKALENENFSFVDFIILPVYYKNIAY